MRKHLPVPVILILLLVSIIQSCGDTHEKSADTLNSVYPSPLPDSTALVFLPGIVSGDSMDFNAAFSPDGQSYYFSRASHQQTAIYVIHHHDSGWSAPAPVTFGAAGYSDADPAFAPDGRLYFISNRPKNASDTLRDYDIWRVSGQADGRWSTPEYLPAINTDSNEYYISFTAKGDLYFASSRPGNLGEEDIYVSRWDNGGYTIPENLGPGVNTTHSEFDPFIDPQERFLLFASSGRTDSYGKADLYYAPSNGRQQWPTAIHLDNRVNTATRDFCPYVSPDGHYFFFSSDRNVKWITARYIDQFGKDRP